MKSFIRGSANSFACGCGLPVVPRALRLKKWHQSDTNAVFIRGESIAHGKTILACCGCQPRRMRLLYEYSNF